MALTRFQRDVCRLLARNRISSGESYVAADALSEILEQPRVSRDVDLFHDRYDAVARTWDPGLNPIRILDEAARSSHYTRAEINALAYDGTVPAADDLSRTWRSILTEARAVVEALPGGEVGSCVLNRSGALLRAGAAELRERLSQGQVQFHAPALRGAFPCFIKPEQP